MKFVFGDRVGETLYSGVNLRIGEFCYRTSKMLLVVDIAKLGICYLYGWMVRMPLKLAHGCRFLS